VNIAKDPVSFRLHFNITIFYVRFSSPTVANVGIERKFTSLISVNSNCDTKNEQQQQHDGKRAFIIKILLIELMTKQIVDPDTAGLDCS